MSPSPLSRLAALLLQIDRPQANQALRATLSDFGRLSAQARSQAQLEHLRLYLQVVIRHCDYYTERLPNALTLKSLSWDGFRNLPLTTRSDVQSQGSAMRFREPRGTFRPIKVISTSGSTGQPIRTEQTLARAVLQKELATAWHLHAGRDFNADTAFVTEPLPPGKADPPRGWKGPPWEPEHGRGRGHLLTLNASPQEQLAWLVQTRAKYFVTYPSNLAMLLWESRQSGVVPEQVEEVMLSSEPIGDVLVRQTGELWSARVTGTYSSSELGVIALQNRAGEYETQDASVLVEVLDDDGKATPAGSVGKVVVTTLQEALRPLIRYEVGDYARVEQGPEGELRLAAIVGRKRTMIETKSGQKRWPYFELDEVTERSNIKKWQLVQHGDRSLTIRVVALAPLTPEDQCVIARSIERVSEGLPLSIVQVDTIGRTPAGKYLEVVSELE